MATVISVRNLTKEFQGFKAVDDLSFSVQAGEIYGFLGQNGAGKSTTIRMLLTLIRPTAGEIEMLGMNLKQHRREILRQVGAIIERPDLYKYLTAIENLRLFATLSGIRPTHSQLTDQLAMVGLADRAHSKVKTYSQGMKQRLGIATALIHDPQLIILDEPTNGLDPQGIADIRNLILHLSREKAKTILVSSHLLSEMEVLADSMLIIDKGRKVIEGRARDLFDPMNIVMELKTTAIVSSWQILQQSPWKDQLLQQRKDSILLKLPQRNQPSLVRYLVEKGEELVSFHAKNTLEDYFLSLTSGQQHVEAFTD